MMTFDYKKEFKEFYQPKTAPGIISVPPVVYAAVRGKGDPNEEGGAYKNAVGVLYGILYTIKMGGKNGHFIEGYFDFVVPPLEGFWDQGNIGFNPLHKELFKWISVIRLPEFVTEEVFERAVTEASRKKKLDCSKAELFRVEEGLCVQCLHIGSYDDEPKTVAEMDKFLAANGYVNDFSKTRLHHEIYLGDPRKTEPDKLKTIIRHPIRKA